MRIQRRAREVFRPPLPCDPRLAENRFHEALETARASYRRIVQAAPPPPGFVHSQWEENIREVESYFLDRFGRVDTVPLHFLPGNHYRQATGRNASGGKG